LPFIQKWDTYTKPHSGLHVAAVGLAFIFRIQPTKGNNPFISIRYDN
jgi:hypothetical protein